MLSGQGPRGRWHRLNSVQNNTAHARCNQHSVCAQAAARICQHARNPTCATNCPLSTFAGASRFEFEPHAKHARDLALAIQLGINTESLPGVDGGHISRAQRCMCVPSLHVYVNCGAPAGVLEEAKSDVRHRLSAIVHVCPGVAGPHELPLQPHKGCTDSACSSVDESGLLTS